MNLCDRSLCEIAYSLAKQPRKALKAYEKAHAWRELFALALEQEISSQALTELCERVSGTFLAIANPSFSLGN